MPPSQHTNLIKICRLVEIDFLGYLYFLFSGPVLCSLFFTAMVSFSVRYYIRHAFLAAVRSYPAPHEHVPHFPKESTAAHS